MKIILTFKNVKIKYYGVLFAYISVKMCMCSIPRATLLAGHMTSIWSSLLCPEGPAFI